MGILDSFKARKALMTQQKGNTAEAKKAYEELYAGNYISAGYLLPYSVLLLREGGEENYLKVKEILKKAEKAPDLDAGRKQQLFMNYAVAQYKLGEIEKAIQLLEASHRKAPCGLTYQSLGWLYIEAAEKEKALANNQKALDYDDEGPSMLDKTGLTDAVKGITNVVVNLNFNLEAQASEEKGPIVLDNLGQTYAEKALAYNLEALDYDDEDPIVLDNLGQTYYRLLNDKEKAKEYFDKAIEIKDSQIDTLYFLAQYDKEAGDKKAAVEKLEKALEGRFSPLNYATKELIQKEIDELKK